MTSTTATKTGPGRPAIAGKRIEIKLEIDLLDQLDAYATEHGMRRPDALRALLRAGLGATGATTAQAPTRSLVADLFPEADDDKATYDLISDECHSMTHSIEVADEFAQRYFQVYLVRGRHILAETNTVDGETSYRFDVLDTAAAARQAFAERIVDITTELWDPTVGVQMWVDFAGEVDLIADLVRTGRIPAAAVDEDGSWLK